MNMSYCRFQNTLTAFRECVDALGEIDSIESHEEREAAISLLKKAGEVLVKMGAVEGRLIERVIIQEVDESCTDAAIPEGGCSCRACADERRADKEAR